jgi:hypothetical protein
MCQGQDDGPVETGLDWTSLEGLGAQEARLAEA